MELQHCQLVEFFESFALYYIKKFIDKLPTGSAPPPEKEMSECILQDCTYITWLIYPVLKTCLICSLLHDFSGLNDIEKINEFHVLYILNGCKMYLL